jgi:hypothetical protein
MPVLGCFQGRVVINDICTTRLYHPGSPKSLFSLIAFAAQRLSQLMVPRDGIEPPTLRFSVACSTN